MSFLLLIAASFHEQMRLESSLFRVLENIKTRKSYVHFPKYSPQPKFYQRTCFGGNSAVFPECGMKIQPGTSNMLDGGSWILNVRSAAHSPPNSTTVKKNRKLEAETPNWTGIALKSYKLDLPTWSWTSRMEDLTRDWGFGTHEKYEFVSRFSL